MKTFFMNDYGEGAHPIVMQRLLETNMEHTCLLYTSDAADE